MAYTNSQLNSNERAVLKTLLYSDIFDFPLTSDELWEYLVASRRVSKKVFDKTLAKLSKNNHIVFEDVYFCLFGREETIKKRKSNLPEVGKKLQIAQKAAYYLSRIPTIKFIGISGGLAMHDVDPEDDIDFFVITKEKTLFVTRIWILAILSILKLRRTRLDKNPANKICVNFLIDEKNLSFFKRKHDLYIAHEIVQIKPLFERDNIYKKFIKTNMWVKQFFPNADMSGNTYFLHEHQLLPGFIKGASFIFNSSFFSGILERVQIMSIKRHKTTENVSKSILAFHPNDYRVQILEELNLKMRQFGLLTKI